MQPAESIHLLPNVFGGSPRPISLFNLVYRAIRCACEHSRIDEVPTQGHDVVDDQRETVAQLAFRHLLPEGQSRGDPLQQLVTNWLLRRVLLYSPVPNETINPLTSHLWFTREQLAKDCGDGIALVVK